MRSVVLLAIKVCHIHSLTYALRLGIGTAQLNGNGNNFGLIC